MEYFCSKFINYIGGKSHIHFRMHKMTPIFPNEIDKSVPARGNNTVNDFMKDLSFISSNSLLMNFV